MKPGIVRWGTPPASLTGRNGGREAGSQWDDVARALIARSGEAAVVLVGTRAEVTTGMGKINGGMVRCFQPAGEFQACTRGTKESGYELWAWHVGGDE